MKNTTRKPTFKASQVIELSDDVCNSDSVEEYNFDGEGNDEVIESEEDFDSSDDLRSVITVSSEAGDEEEKFRLDERPWRYFSTEQRTQWEIMYTQLPPNPIGNSWDMTEAYLREKDAEMRLYMEDFPLSTWTIPKPDADQAYFQCLERNRVRTLGIRLYPYESTPEWTSGTNVSGEQRPQMPRSYSVPNVAPTPNPHIHYHLTIPSMQPPTQILPSQPYAVPMAQQHITSGMPAGNYFLTTNQNNGQQPGTSEATKSRELKNMKDSPISPHAEAESLQGSEPTVTQTVKPRRKKSRKRVAEEEGFPWTRQIDFHEAVKNAQWDDSIYEPTTLISMATTRARNVSIIARVDVMIMDQQRETMRAYRASRRVASASNSLDAREAGSGRHGRGRKKREHNQSIFGSSAVDLYHSGQFCFSSSEEETKAKSFGLRSLDNIVDEIQDGVHSLENIGHIKICWASGKRAQQVDNLERAVFSIKDTILTRRQVEAMPILTQRAAECIIDFCPDMLWRNVLLRIASEAGFGNKDVRDRYCWNGCYCDKATITKRISAALGQRLMQSRKHGPREVDRYNENVQAFSDYIDFFGIRPGHRNAQKPVRSGRHLKRKRDGNDEDRRDVTENVVRSEGGPGTNFSKRNSNKTVMKMSKHAVNADDDVEMPNAPDDDNGNEESDDDNEDDDEDAIDEELEGNEVISIQDSDSSGESEVG